MINLKSFYRNKKVVITGNTGFKGSWLSLILYNLGAKVYGYSLEPQTNPSNFHLFNLSKIIKYVNGDVRNYKKFYKFLNNIKPDIIFHLAAQSLVKQSYLEPLKTFETNFNGTLNLIEISRKLNNLKSLVIITSDKCYFNDERIKGYNENDRLGGIDPYSASKASAENMFFSYSKSFFINSKNIGIVSARAGNVIGGGDWSKDRIIPDFMKSLKNKRSFIIRSPNSTRPWQHVLDLSYGYLLLGMKCYGTNKFNGSWNFGPNKKNSVSVIKIIKYLNSMFKNKKKILIKKEKSIKETKMLFLDSSKSKKLLIWNPKFSIFSSLNNIVEWYNCYYFNKKNIKILTNNQIKKYFQL